MNSCTTLHVENQCANILAKMETNSSLEMDVLLQPLAFLILSQQMDAMRKLLPNAFFFLFLSLITKKEACK